MDLQTIITHTKGVSLTDRVTFTRNLSLIVKAGMSLPEGLEVLSRESSSPLLGMIIKKIKTDVMQGKEFSTALSPYPRVFTSFYVSMIKAGETSGTLEKVLKNLAVHMEKERSLRSKVIGALTYPAVIFLVMVVVIIAMMVFVVPRLMTVFQNFNAELPLTTKLLIALSNFIVNHYLVLLFVVIAFITACWYFFCRVSKGKIALSWIVLHLPVCNRIVKKVNTARIARTLETLIKSGISILNALVITGDVLQNHFYKKMIGEARKEIEKGKSINEVFKKYPHLYPPLAAQLIAVGEETGSLDLVLTDLADFYEEEVDNLTKNLSSIIEPLMMLIIGSAVGLLAISLLQPIYSITSQVNF